MFESLDHCLQQSLQDWQVDDLVEAHRILGHWSSIVGPLIGNETKALYVKNGVLHISVSNSQWMQEIQMQKRSILRNINEWYGRPVIKDIYFSLRKQSYVKDTAPSVTILDDVQLAPQGNIPMHQYAVDDETVQDIVVSVDTVQDEKLQQLLRRLQIDQYKKEQYLATHGYHRCHSCGQWMADDQGSICIGCEQRRHRNYIKAIKKVLHQYPHVKYDVFNKRIPCSLALFNEARRDLIHEWRERIFRGDKSLDLWFALTMIITQRPRSELTEDFVNNVCSKYVSKYIDGH